MSQSNPYAPPSTAISETSVAAVAAIDRRKLVPLWIKIFGWIFMVMGVAIPMGDVVLAFVGWSGTYDIFGLHYQGSPLHPMALVISAIILSLAVSAYGLLFGKPWGLNACLVTGYGGINICLGTMIYSAVAHGNFVFRLELLVQVPYLLKLNKIKPLWLSSGHRADAEA